MKRSFTGPIETRDVPVSTYEVPTYDSATRVSPFDCEVYGPGPSDFRLVLHKSLETRDSILEAQGPGIVCSTGLVWRGDLKPILETHAQTLEPLVTPFTIGPLEPKPTLGRTFGHEWRSTRDHVAKVADAMRTQLRERAVRDEASSDDRVDLSGVLRAINELEAQARDGHPNAVGAAIAALSGAIADAKPAPRRSGDAQVPFRDQGGRAVPQGTMTATIRDFREGRTTDARPRGRMQQANEAFRRARAEERRQVESETPWGPDAA